MAILKPTLSMLGLSLAILASPAGAADVKWVVAFSSDGKVVPGCSAIMSTTARGAVRNCLVKFMGNIPFENFVVTAKPVCQTTHKATSVLGTGFVYDKVMAKVARPWCG